MRAAVLLLLLSACAHRPWESGKASWYGKELRGNPTASGERFRPARRTAAHLSLPFGTVLLVERDGHRVRVVVNDRGPYTKGRVLDLSKGAAKKLGLVDVGVDEVRFRVVGCRTSYDGPKSCEAAR